VTSSLNSSHDSSPYSASVGSPSLYLASQSPRRRELLDQIGVNFETLRVDVPEERQPGESPADYVTRLAADKARAGGELLVATDKLSAPVLGADTVVVLGDQVLEKPENAEAGKAMLLQLANRQHQVMTAVSFYAPCHKPDFKPEQQQTMLSVTNVQFRDIAQAEAERYWVTGEPQDKAGGYGIQGLGAVFVTAIEGSYTGVVGLPIEQTYELLMRFGVPFWQQQQD
jgi:septum formation protein